MLPTWPSIQSPSRLPKSPVHLVLSQYRCELNPASIDFAAIRNEMSDIQKQDLQSLKSQLTEIDLAIEKRKTEELKILVDGFARKLDSLGLSIDTAAKELKSYGRKRAPRSNARRISSDEFVLYANPANPKQTWGGIGHKPGWVNEFLANGGSLERLKV